MNWKKSAGCLGLLFVLSSTLLAWTHHPVPLDSFSAASADTLVIPAGERIVLRLTAPIHTLNNKKGDRCEFATAHNIFLGLERKKELPKGALIRATIAKIERRRLPFRAPVVLFEFNELLLPQGGSIPLKLRIIRTIGGALLDGPDLLLRQDFVLETELVEDLLIPLDNSLLQPWHPPESEVLSPRPVRDSQTTDSNKNPDPGTQTELARPLAKPRQVAAPKNFSSLFKISVDIDLIQVQAVVRNRKGEFLQELQQADFRVLENGVEQTLRQFSHDTTPLAVALLWTTVTA